MNIHQSTYSKLELVSKSFENNISIALDFIFFVFDSYTFGEKQNMLDNCSLTELSNKKEKNDREITVYININQVLEKRLFLLVKECKKLNNLSDAIEFLLFVLQKVNKELIPDIMLQYSNENQTITNNKEVYLDNTGNLENKNPVHVDPIIPHDLL